MAAQNKVAIVTGASAGIGKAAGVALVKAGWKVAFAARRADLLDKACEKVTAREMPMWQYRVLHRESRLTEVDVAALCAWGRQEAARLAGAGS